MARVNIDNKDYTDPRYVIMSKILFGGSGNRWPAIGMMVAIWNYCTEHKTDMIKPETINILCGHKKMTESIISSGFGEEKEGLILIYEGRGRGIWLENLMKKYGKVSMPSSRQSNDINDMSPPLSLSLSLSPSPVQNNYIYKSKEYKDKIDQLLSIWGTTLEEFSIKKDPRLDEVSIYKLMEIYGFEKTKLALTGAAREKGFGDYDPRKNVSITRLFKKDVFEKFVNLGGQDGFEELVKNTTRKK